MIYFYYTGYSFLILSFLLSLIASINVKTTFNKYEKIKSKKNLTGAEAAMHVLRANNLTNIRIERVRGDLTDHFDPKTLTIRLSDKVYDSTSVAAIGVACHEAGHAVQHSEEYVPIKIRSAIIPICQFGSTISYPLILIGLIMSSYPLAFAGVLLFSLMAIFQFITLPVEFNASKRAMETIKSSSLLYHDEQNGAKKVLSAAALTYVVALISTILQILRLLMIINNNRRR